MDTTRYKYIQLPQAKISRTPRLLAMQLNDLFREKGQLVMKIQIKNRTSSGGRGQKTSFYQGNGGMEMTSIDNKAYSFIKLGTLQGYSHYLTFRSPFKSLTSPITWEGSDFKTLSNHLNSSRHQVKLTSNCSIGSGKMIKRPYALSLHWLEWASG